MTASGSLSGFIIQKAEKTVHIYIVGPLARMYKLNAFEFETSVKLVTGPSFG